MSIATFPARAHARANLYTYLEAHPIPACIEKVKTKLGFWGNLKVQHEAVTKWIMYDKDKGDAFANWLLDLVEQVQQRKGVFHEAAQQTNLQASAYVHTYPAGISALDSPPFEHFRPTATFVGKTVRRNSKKPSTSRNRNVQRKRSSGSAPVRRRKKTVGNRRTLGMA